MVFGFNSILTTQVTSSWLCCNRGLYLCFLWFFFCYLVGSCLVMVGFR